MIALALQYISILGRRNYYTYYILVALNPSFNFYTFLPKLTLSSFALLPLLWFILPCLILPSVQLLSFLPRFGFEFFPFVLVSLVPPLLSFNHIYCNPFYSFYILYSFSSSFCCKVKYRLGRCSLPPFIFSCIYRCSFFILIHSSLSLSLGPSFLNHWVVVFRTFFPSVVCYL